MSLVGVALHDSTRDRCLVFRGVCVDTVAIVEILMHVPLESQLLRYNWFGTIVGLGSRVSSRSLLIVGSRELYPAPLLAWEDGSRYYYVEPPTNPPRPSQILVT